MYVREASHLLETYVPRLDRDLVELGVFDGGDLPVDEPEELRAGLSGLDLNGVKPVFLGGDHTISTFTVERMAELFPDLCVLSFDAHADAYLEYEGDHFAHATWARRVGEHLGEGRVFLVGARAYTREERDWFSHRQRLLPIFEVDLETAVRTVAAEVGPRPLYVSIDVDVLDPAWAPGVGNPEGLGATYRELRSSLDVLKESQVVAFDVVEVIGGLDPSGRTALTGAELLRDNILTWW